MAFGADALKIQTAVFIVSVAMFWKYFKQRKIMPNTEKIQAHRAFAVSLEKRGG